MRNFRARDITPDGRPVFAEKHEHKTVAQWLMMNGIYFLHVPNEVPNFRRGKPTPQEILNRIIWQKEQKQMGKKKGAVDFIIFDPPPGKPTAPGTVLEIKALDGDPPTQDQYEFLSEMGARRWANAWFYGADDSIRWLESLGYGRF